MFASGPAGGLWAVLPGLVFLLSACAGVWTPITATTEFDLANRRLVSTGRSRYFVLEPGFQLVLENRVERVVITVLDETRLVDGVTTRVIEEKSWLQGQLSEVARNFFAIDEKTNDVFYFGEEVDNYRGGRLINHDSSWLAGKGNAKPGLIMPGQPRKGMKYFQEVSPGLAMDFASITALGVTLDTPAGRFTDCLQTEEGNALNSFEKETKIYAPAIGLAQSGDLFLTKHGTVR